VGSKTAIRVRIQFGHWQSDTVQNIKPRSPPGRHRSEGTKRTREWRESLGDKWERQRAREEMSEHNIRRCKRDQRQGFREAGPQRAED
jgi:hypothetical protein